MDRRSFLRRYWDRLIDRPLVFKHEHEEEPLRDQVYILRSRIDFLEKHVFSLRQENRELRNRLTDLDGISE